MLVPRRGGHHRRGNGTRRGGLPSCGGTGALSNTNVTAKGLARLAAARCLVSLTLRGSTVTDDTLQGAQRLSQLELLRLVETNASSAGLAHLAGLSQLREVRRVPWIGNRRQGAAAVHELVEARSSPAFQDGCLGSRYGSPAQPSCTPITRHCANASHRRRTGAPGRS